MAQTGVHTENERVSRDPDRSAPPDPMNWYYAKAGQQAGPVDEAQLDALLKNALKDLYKKRRHGVY